jgi:hypothetical protein
VNPKSKDAWIDEDFVNVAPRLLRLAAEVELQLASAQARANPAILDALEQEAGSILTELGMTNLDAAAYVLGLDGGR